MEVHTEVLIVGGGLGGAAAALATSRLGRQTILASQHQWLGGQLTTQGVPPDEHPWIERVGATASYRTLRREIREYYRHHYPLTERARLDPYLNPGNAWVSRLAHEPRVATRVLDGLLAPPEATGNLTVWRGYRPVEVILDRDYIRAVRLLRMDGQAVTVTADYVLDATELGDLLQLGEIEYVVGAESQTQTNEPHAAVHANSLNQQSFTWVFAIEHRPGEDHTIDRPAMYDFWRAYRAPFWPGPLLGWVYPDPVTLQAAQGTLDFEGDRPALAGPPERPSNTREGAVNLWTYRRIRHAGHLAQRLSEISIVNWPQNDYWLRPLIDVSADEQQQALGEAKQLSLCLLYWLQTEAPRPDAGAGFPGLRLHREAFDTSDGLAPEPYIRESRRIQAEFTVLEQHVSVQARLDQGPTPFHDSVGIGAYRIDLHPSTGGDNYIDLCVWPFQIPLGALIPIRVENLLPAAKNAGLTHVTNGCYRLHPVEWTIGEAAGVLAAYCLSQRVTPRTVRNTPNLLQDFQRLIATQGIETEWPERHPL